MKKLANLAGVTVRTLHHYDEIGLLKPSGRTEKGYRLYGDGDLLRLQQIMIYKELEFSLAEIQGILDGKDFDLKQALAGHRQKLVDKQERYGELIETIDKTIARIDGDELVTDEDLYAGFTPEEVEACEEEAVEKYGEEKVDEVNSRIKKMTKNEWADVQAEGEKIPADLAGMLDKDPADDQVQEVVVRHRAWIENFYPVTKEVYVGLAQMYVEDERFRAFYDKHGEGVAELLSAGMKVYAVRNL